MNKKNKTIISIMLIIFSAFFSLLAAFYITFSPAKLIFPVERFEYAKNHPDEFTEKELKDLEKIQYKNVDLEVIPDDCINAIVSAEDDTFWTNSGIDRNGTIRLLVSSLLFKRQYGGGSTITQQLVKMYTDQYYDRNALDKIKEIIWSYRISSSLSKEEVLERYLNNLYMGEYNYGVGMASIQYFGKEISELNREECAYLMAIPQSPNTLLSNQEQWDRRKDFVLDRMEEEGY